MMLYCFELVMLRQRARVMGCAILVRIQLGRYAIEKNLEITSKLIR